MTQAMLVTQDLRFAYPGDGRESDHAALRGIDVSVGAGEFVALIGQNGSGKTTLAKHLNGLLRATGGSVSVDGNPIGETPVASLARTVGFVFQNPDHQIFSASVREEVEVGPKNLGLPPDEIRCRVDEVLRELDLEPYAQRQPAVLSFGLRRKVAVAAVLAMNTPVLVLDEPSVGLDARHIETLMASIQSRHRAGHTIVLITHDMRLVAEYAPRCVVLDGGQVVLDGDTRWVFGQAEVLQATRLAVPQISDLARRLAPVGLPEVLTVNEFCLALERLDA